MNDLLVGVGDVYFDIEGNERGLIYEYDNSVQSGFSSMVPLYAQISVQSGFTCYKIG